MLDSAVRKTIAYIFLLFGFSIFYYIPIIANPALFLSRDNDLQEQFWPMFYFVKNQLLEHRTLPFWYPHILSGTPLLPDPQAPLFYPPNIIFLVTSVDVGFIFSFFIHLLFAAVFMYLAARIIASFDNFTSLFVAILYAGNPKFASFMVAGHVGLVFSWAWIPLTFIATYKLVDSKNKKWIALLATSLAMLFVLHTITFAIIAAANGFFVLYLIISTNSRINKLLLFSLASILALGLVSITFLPQLEWSPTTTRSILIEKSDVYPKWNTKTEFLQSLVFPWALGTSGLQKLETEKFYPFGLSVLFLASFGYKKLKRKQKLILVTIVGMCLIIAMNNVSPLEPLLLQMNWYKLFRVSTRVLIIPLIISFILAGYGLSQFSLNKRKAFFAITIVELFLLSWIYLSRPVSVDTSLPESFLLSLSTEEPSRVYCLNRCISQKQAVLHNLELIDGYSTLIQMNYYQRFWAFSGKYWDYYTLSLPPMGIYTHEKQKPDLNVLGIYNTKYIISPYVLLDNNLKYIETYNGTTLYENLQFKSRAYYVNDLLQPLGDALIISKSPNKITIDVSHKSSNKLVLSEVYSTGWKAKIDGIDIKVQETPDALRFVNLQTGGNTLEIFYDPPTFKIGILITIISIVTTLLIVVL